MSQVMRVTWAQEAIDGALERAEVRLKQVDEESPEIARISIADLACLVDLGRHAMRENEKIGNALEFCLEAIEGWRSPSEPVCLVRCPESAVTDLETVMDKLL